MSRNNTFFIVCIVILVICVSNNAVYAFGAGNIPSFAYLEGKAFRHGDIEDALADLAKTSGGFALGSLIGKSGSKFHGLDIKRVYFGNWLRDYSQAVDIAGLKKLQLQTIINLCMVLGFLAHGYATHEFEVTEERLGVYLPTEHIDNPKGYGEGEDARKYHPKLRGPVDPRELEIDPRTGMKNYIANENGTWDTSKALVRRTLERCIHLGRQHRTTNDKRDLYEAYRLLGQALHTLEDFPAHSNFCELALVSMGHNEVFLHVGDHVRIQAANGKWVAPIVTGTFGGNDFIHSLLGEAGDHLSQASVTDLNKELDNARAKSQSSRSGPGGDSGTMLRDLFFSLPGGTGGDMARDMENVERIRAGPQQGGKRPEDMSPQELHAVLWQILSFRDSVMKKIEKTVERIPGLGALIEKLTDSISVFVFTTLEPFLKPVLKSATTGLSTASGEVIDSQDQYEVFNDPRASDPTHSFLSKDHFNLILNEPAGLLAKTALAYTVQLVAKAWGDNSVNVHQLTDEVTQCFFHPDFVNPNSKIQGEMMRCMQGWVQSLGNRKQSIIQRLSKESVKNHKNIRLAGEGGQAAAQGTYAQQEGLQVQHAIGGYLNQVPGVAQASSLLNSVAGGQGKRRDEVGTSYTGAGQGQGQPAAYPSYQTNAPPPVTTGEASSFFAAGNPPSSYSAGPAPAQSSYGSAPTQSSYKPPPGPPSSGFPGGGESRYDGYNLSYNPSYPSTPPSFPNSGAPSFPGGEPSFPGAGGGPSFPGHGEPPSFHGRGPPSFPGGGPSSFPGGGPPAFPDMGPGGFNAPPGPPSGSGYGRGFPESTPYGMPNEGMSFPGADPSYPQPHGHHHQHQHQHHNQHPY